MKLNKENNYAGKIMMGFVAVATDIALLLAMAGCSPSKNNDVASNDLGIYIEASTDKSTENSSDNVLENSTIDDNENSVEEPVVEEPVVKEPIVEEPVVEEPVVEEPIVEEPVVEEPVVEEPVEEIKAERIDVIKVYNPVSSKYEYHFVVFDSYYEYDEETTKEAGMSMFGNTALKDYLNTDEISFWHAVARYKSIFSDDIRYVTRTYGAQYNDEDNFIDGVCTFQYVYNADLITTNFGKIIVSPSEDILKNLNYSWCQNVADNTSFQDENGLYDITVTPLTAYGYDGELTIIELKEIRDNLNNTNDKNVVLEKTNK